MKKNIKEAGLRIRLTSEQKQRLADMSLQLNMTMSEIVISLIENGKIEPTTQKELDPIIRANLGRAFSNINQMARVFNSARLAKTFGLEHIQAAQEALYKNERLLAGIMQELRKNNDRPNN